MSRILNVIVLLLVVAGLIWYFTRPDVETAPPDAPIAPTAQP